MTAFLRFLFRFFFGGWGATDEFDFQTVSVLWAS